MTKRYLGITIDLFIIIASLILAIMLIESELVHHILAKTGELKYFGSFFAGILFTSIFTTAPAIAALVELSQEGSVFMTALLGAIGSVVGDYILFRFVRDRLTDHVNLIWQEKTHGKRLKTLTKFKLFRWMTIFIGCVVIASPFPDEIGISLIGLSHIKTKYFIPLSFVFNFIGILLIGLISRSTI